MVLGKKMKISLCHLNISVESAQSWNVCALQALDHLANNYVFVSRFEKLTVLSLNCGWAKQLEVTPQMTLS